MSENFDDRTDRDRSRMHPSIGIPKGLGNCETSESWKRIKSKHPQGDTCGRFDCVKGEFFRNMLYSSSAFLPNNYSISDIC